LVSERAGCAITLVPDPAGTTGLQIDPYDVEEMVTQLSWMAACSPADRAQMGQRAAALVSSWGPDRFARGFVQALESCEFQDSIYHGRPHEIAAEGK
jgi:hypothetical protein